MSFPLPLTPVSILLGKKTAKKIERRKRDIGKEGKITHKRNGESAAHQHAL